VNENVNEGTSKNKVLKAQKVNGINLRCQYQTLSNSRKQISNKEKDPNKMRFKLEYN